MATQLKIFPIPSNGVLNVEGGRFLVDTAGAPVDIFLPHGTAVGCSFIIYDATRNAAANPITIQAIAGELINGAATLVLNQNGDSADIFNDGANGFIATLSGAATGTGGGGGGGGSATLQVSGDPAPGAGVIGQFAWDDTTKLLYIKSASGWNIH